MKDRHVGCMFRYITGGGLFQVRIMTKRSKVSVFGVKQHKYCVYIYISLCCDSVHCTQLCLLCTTFLFRLGFQKTDIQFSPTEKNVLRR